MTDEQSTTAEEPPVVVKIGGAKAVDPAGAVGDVAHLAANGRRVVVVHGGSTVVDEVIERLGMEPEYVESASGVTGRFTDAETMEAFTMAMAGKLNTELTALFARPASTRSASRASTAGSSRGRASRRSGWLKTAKRRSAAASTPAGSSR